MLAHTPLKSRSACIADRELRHLEFEDFRRDPFGFDPDEPVVAVYRRWLRSRGRYLGAGREDAWTPEDRANWRAQNEIDDEPAPGGWDEEDDPPFDPDRYVDEEAF